MAGYCTQTSAALGQSSAYYCNLILDCFAHGRYLVDKEVEVVLETERYYDMKSQAVGHKCYALDKSR